MRGMRLWNLLIVLAMGTVMPAQAQTAPQTSAANVAPAPTPDAATAPIRGANTHPLDPGNPFSAPITAMATSLARTLTDPQIRALSMIKLNFGMMGAVRVAEGSVSRAVDSCGDHNPAMKQAITARFDDWKQTVGPALAEQDHNLERTVKSGIAGEPKKIDAYLDLIEKAANYAAQKQSYPPAATAPACENLMASMDRTKIVMAQLLAGAVWPTATMFKPAQSPAAPADAAPATTPITLPAVPTNYPHSTPAAP